MRAEKKKTVPSYEYPDAVVTAAMCNRYSKYGVEFRVERNEAVRISALDEQRSHRKGIFGSGLLLSRSKAGERTVAERTANERAAARSAAARVWRLSDRELELQEALG